MKITNVRSVYEAIKINKPIIDRIIKYAKNGDVAGFTPPSSIIGEKNYPKVSIGVLFNDMSDSSVCDDHMVWTRENYDVSRILAAKAGLVNAVTKVEADRPDTGFMQKIQLAIISKTEVPINASISRLGISPYGDGFRPVSARLERLRISDDVKTEKTVERVFYDRDMKAEDGIALLGREGVDGDKISRILSVGAMGHKRKIVPTKWAITAVDDTLGKRLLDTVRSLETSETYGIKTGSFLGNRFTFIFIRGEWSFELIEAWNRNEEEIMVGESDYELYDGRKEYVKNTAGAYYAIRLAVLEKLSQMKIQCSVIVIREVTPEYFAPLGVWVVREGARKSLRGELELFQDIDHALKSARDRMIYDGTMEKSRILKLRRAQTRLSAFF